MNLDLEQNNSLEKKNQRIRERELETLRSTKTEILEQAKSNMIAQGVTPKINTCCFINASSLIPEGVERDFWRTLSENSPFSWGDNNKSLVCAIDLLHHIKEIEDNFSMPKDTLNKIIQELESLEETYIDLEN